MISLSPLPTTHPEAFQRLSVRTSMTCYRHFILLMGRSQGFASTATDCRPIQTCFRCGCGPEVLNLASDEQLVGSLCKRHAVTYCYAPTACRRTVSGTISLPCLGCFSPFPYGTGSLSVSEEYLALPDGAGRFRQDSSGPALLRILLVLINFCLRGYHPLWLNFPEDFT